MTGCNNFLPFFSTVSLKAILQFRDPLKEETRDTGNFGNQGIRVLHHLITILVRARKEVYSRKASLRSSDRPWKRSQKFFISLSLHSKFRNKRGQVFSFLKRFWCVFVMSRPRRLLHTYSRDFFGNLPSTHTHTKRAFGRLHLQILIFKKILGKATTCACLRHQWGFKSQFPINIYNREEEGDFILWETDFLLVEKKK